MAQLTIRSRNPQAGAHLDILCDLLVELDGVEVRNLANLTLWLERHELPTAEIVIQPDGIEVDAEVLAALVALVQPSPHGTRRHKALRMRPCLDCGTPSRGTRCLAHTAERERGRGTRQQRGLGATHQQARAALIATSATVCALCGQQGSWTDARDPLTAHHTTPRAHGGHDSPLVPAHSSCNARDGANVHHVTWNITRGYKPPKEPLDELLPPVRP